MSRVLPAELQTKKVKSLSGDAKKLVEDLLAEKFDIKEEVAPKKAKSFRPSEAAWGLGGFKDSVFGIESAPDVRDGRGMGRRRDIEVSVQPWNGLRIAKLEVDYPDEGSLIDAFRQLDNEMGRRERRKVFVGRRFLRELMRDNRFDRSFRMMAAFAPREGEEREIGEIFGFPVVQIGNPRYENQCFVHQEF